MTVPGYHLHILALPPTYSPSLTDLTFTLQPDGSFSRTLIPIRTYMSKPLVLAAPTQSARRNAGLDVTAAADLEPG